MNATIIDRQTLPLPGGSIQPMREACWNPAYGGYGAQLFPVMPDSNFPIFPLLWPHNNRASDHNVHHGHTVPSFPRHAGPPKNSASRNLYSKDHAKENTKTGAANAPVVKEATLRKGADAVVAVKQERTKDSTDEKEAARNNNSDVKAAPTASGTHQQAPEANEAGGKRKPWRILLTGEQAREIYLRRPGTENPGTSLSLAAEFGVSVKTIRDIWNRETWIRSTRPLWTPEEQELHLAACQAKTELVNAKAAGAVLTDPPLSAAPGNAGRKRELGAAVGGGAKKAKTGKGGGAEASKGVKSEEDEGPGLNDAAADADAVAGLLMMCSAR
mmetsp:Transcript_6524/g.15193  ORF Transcript_6524/g.15193 Transcript_6524/m.15193 type:complete len:329 (+) Transcript_6524:217-1203(+)